jgi:Ser/Thr protein kinase RdoA (MazF antagonist)
MEEVLHAYGLKDAVMETVSGGLINSTWKVTTHTGTYILQKINDQVFQNPENIAANISLIAAWLKERHPDYFLVSPVPSIDGRVVLFFKNRGWFRLFPFAEGTHTIHTVTTPEQAYEASFQFGKFTNTLSGFDAAKLHITIPHFHDLALRYDHFLQALQTGNKERLGRSKKAVRELQQYASIVAVYKAIRKDPAFRVRVTHHDTKISNVLFNKNEKAVCVIDLDTVMPGYFISDVGDMIRTYVSPVGEEEQDFTKIIVRKDFYRAIEEGYSAAMGGTFSETERKYFFYSGTFMVYMQALRFLTDYLNNDIYYRASYPEHNFIRAGNQLRLLQLLLEHEKELSFDN